MLADPLPGYEIYCTATRNCVSSTQPNPWIAFGGTSAATPLLAGGLALVDQDLRLHGQTDLGFVNPLLYSARRSSFGRHHPHRRRHRHNDISSELFGRALGCCTARTGYDEASGLGSVNLSGLAAIARARVSKQITVSLTRPPSRARSPPATCSRPSPASGELPDRRLRPHPDRPRVQAAHRLLDRLRVSRRRRHDRHPLGGSTRNAISTALLPPRRLVATIRGRSSTSTAIGGGRQRAAAVIPGLSTGSAGWGRSRGVGRGWVCHQRRVRCERVRQTRRGGGGCVTSVAPAATCATNPALGTPVRLGQPAQASVDLSSAPDHRLAVGVLALVVEHLALLGPGELLDRAPGPGRR